MLVPEGLVGIHRTIQLQHFSITGQGIDLDYCDIEWFALETTEIILSFLRLHPSTAFQTPNIKSVTVSFVSLSICHELMGPDAVILVF